jgi:hypothetical protein
VTNCICGQLQCTEATGGKTTHEKWVGAQITMMGKDNMFNDPNALVGMADWWTSYINAVIPWYSALDTEGRKRCKSWRDQILQMAHAARSRAQRGPTRTARMSVGATTKSKILPTPLQRCDFRLSQQQIHRTNVGFERNRKITEEHGTRYLEAVHELQGLHRPADSVEMRMMVKRVRDNRGAEVDGDIKDDTATQKTAREGSYKCPRDGCETRYDYSVELV